MIIEKLKNLLLVSILILIFHSMFVFANDTLFDSSSYNTSKELNFIGFTQDQIFNRNIKCQRKVGSDFKPAELLHIQEQLLGNPKCFEFVNLKGDIPRSFFSEIPGNNFYNECQCLKDQIDRKQFFGKKINANTHEDFRVINEFFTKKSKENRAYHALNKIRSFNKANLLYKHQLNITANRKSHCSGYDSFKGNILKRNNLGKNSCNSKNTIKVESLFRSIISGCKDEDCRGIDIKDVFQPSQKDLIRAGRNLNKKSSKIAFGRQLDKIFEILESLNKINYPVNDNENPDFFKKLSKKDYTLYNKTVEDFKSSLHSNKLFKYFHDGLHKNLTFVMTDFYKKAKKMEVFSNNKDIGNKGKDKFITYIDNYYSEVEVKKSNNNKCDSILEDIEKLCDLMDSSKRANLYFDMNDENLRKDSLEDFAKENNGDNLALRKYFCIEAKSGLSADSKKKFSKSNSYNKGSFSFIMDTKCTFESNEFSQDYSECYISRENQDFGFLYTKSIDNDMALMKENSIKNSNKKTSTFRKKMNERSKSLSINSKNIFNSPIENDFTQSFDKINSDDDNIDDINIIDKNTYEKTGKSDNSKKYNNPRKSFSVDELSENLEVSESSSKDFTAKKSFDKLKENHEKSEVDSDLENQITSLENKLKDKEKSMDDLKRKAQEKELETTKKELAKLKIEVASLKKEIKAAKIIKENSKRKNIVNNPVSSPSRQWSASTFGSKGNFSGTSTNNQEKQGSIYKDVKESSDSINSSAFSNKIAPSNQKSSLLRPDSKDSRKQLLRESSNSISSNNNNKNKNSEALMLLSADKESLRTYYNEVYQKEGPILHGEKYIILIEDPKTKEIIRKIVDKKELEKKDLKKLSKKKNLSPLPKRQRILKKGLDQLTNEIK